MKFVTYLDGKKERVGVLNEDETWVYPLRAFGMPYESMQEVVEKMSRYKSCICIDYITNSAKMKCFLIKSIDSTKTNC